MGEYDDKFTIEVSRTEGIWDIVWISKELNVTIKEFRRLALNERDYQLKLITPKFYLP